MPQFVARIQLDCGACIALPIEIETKHWAVSEATPVIEEVARKLGGELAGIEPVEKETQ